MRLKSIKLAGFKSFVDPTTVHFPSNLAAVVGPNGCGKSNIIDAVRWVMGESSAKNLRGESMEDVIFNGSVNRKPVGQASIELIFDNSDGKITGEYARFSEISIRRRVTREGQSEYFLNGTKCRRRDITDIFLGTGLGPRSYAIIEQGMISRLIEAKPEDLRVFIEEAAGISKYKERRRETENRMRRTVENLDRLTDLRDELERQLQHLKRQSQSAERYTELKKEERLVRAQLQALQWQRFNEQLSGQENQIREREVKLESVIAEQRSIDTAIEKYRDQHIEQMDAYNEIQQRFYGLGAEIARSEQSIQHQQERGQQLRADLQQLEHTYREAEQHLAGDSEKLAQWQREVAEIAPQLDSAQSAEQETAAALIRAEQLMQAWQQHWDEFNQRAAQPKQQAEVQQSRIQQLELMLQRIQERIARLEQEQASLSATPVQQQIDQLREQVAVADEAVIERQQHLEQLAGQIQQLRSQNAELANTLDHSRNRFQSLRGRQASLEALQQAALGQSDGVVSDWLNSQQLSDRPRLGEQIQVAEGWDTAVETVLGNHLQAVCVDGLDAVAELAGQLEKGSLTLVDRTPVTLAASLAEADTLASKVTRGDTGALLAGIYAVEELADALALRSRLAPHESVVTAAGLWLGPNWLRVSRDSDQQAGTLRRQQELEQLSAELEALTEQIEQQEEAQNAGRDQLLALEQQREELQKTLQGMTRQHAELRSQLSAEQVKVEQITTRRAQIAREISESREQFEHEQENLAEARMTLEQAIEAMESDSGERERLLAERDQNREMLDRARQTARHDKDSAHQLAMRHQSLLAQLQSMEQNIQRTRSQVEQLAERRETLQEALAGADEPLLLLQETLAEQLEKRLAVEEELTAARRQVDELEHALRQCESQRHEVEQRSQDLRSQLESLRVNAQGLQVQRRALEEQLIETRFDRDQLLATMPEDATESSWQEALESLGRKIARLGPINLAAIDEYKIQSERKTYLDAQNDDLVEALKTLESAIAKIDRETRQRFKDTFDTVNNSLQELFPKVFGGGTAYLELTGDNLLDTGIAIMARPPGKRNSTIHLLSGGEKAMTAIALVFSIFSLNPAPFCMLDEVDAPLDDANVGRYARLVKEMSEKVQFIFITHNKITMEMADQLMGVTMHEPGVSRLVSVDIDAAAEMALA